MSASLRRSNYNTLKKDKEIDKEKKDIESFTSKDGSITIVKTEKTHKNYRFNKLIKNDEDAKIIQNFCRAKMRPILQKRKEERQKIIQKEEEEKESNSNNLKGDYFSRYRKNILKEQGNSSSSKSKETQIKQDNNDIYKSKKMNENSKENKSGNQIDENSENTNNGKNLFSKGYRKNLQNSNENNSSDNAINELEENNFSSRLKRKKYNNLQKNNLKEEQQKQEFVPTYHEKKKIEYNNSQLDRNNYDKNYKYQEIEVIPLRFCDDYTMNFYSPYNLQYVEPYINPDIIITEIKFEENYIPQNNIGYVRGIKNNINYYKQNISRNERFFKNQNSYGRQINKTSYKGEYKYKSPFTNVIDSRNDSISLGRSQNSQFNNHELKTSYASRYY